MPGVEPAPPVPLPTPDPLPPVPLPSSEPLPPPFWEISDTIAAGGGVVAVLGAIVALLALFAARRQAKAAEESARVAQDQADVSRGQHVQARMTEVNACVRALDRAAYALMTTGARLARVAQRPGASGDSRELANTAFADALTSFDDALSDFEGVRRLVSFWQVAARLRRDGYAYRIAVDALRRRWDTEQIQPGDPDATMAEQARDRLLLTVDAYRRAQDAWLDAANRDPVVEQAVADRLNGPTP